MSFAGQTFKKEKTRLSLTQIMIIVFKQSESVKINKKLSFAGQTVKKEKTRLSLAQIMIMVR